MAIIQRYHSTRPTKRMGGCRRTDRYPNLKESNMITREDIEAFLDRLSADGASHQELEPGLWLVRPSGALEFDVVVTHNPPVLLLRRLCQIFSQSLGFRV